jgi:hypothetical protein
VRGACTKRDRVPLQVLHAARPRVSEIAGLTCRTCLRATRGRCSCRSLARAASCARCCAGTCQQVPAGAARRRWRERCSLCQPQDGRPAGRAGNPGPRQARRRARRPRGARVTALAAPRARVTCHRPRRHANRGTVDVGARQHRHHVGLSAYGGALFRCRICRGARYESQYQHAASALIAGPLMANPAHGEGLEPCAQRGPCRGCWFRGCRCHGCRIRLVRRLRRCAHDRWRGPTRDLSLA